jgi:hypothetical protein
MKLKSNAIERIDFVNGDSVHRCDSIWVGQLGNYTKAGALIAAEIDRLQRKSSLAGCAGR